MNTVRAMGRKGRHYGAILLLAMLAGCSGAGTEAGGGVGGGDPGGNGGGNGGGGSGAPLDITPEFTVRNDQPTERTETILASVPFPKGARPDLANVGVADHATAWRVLQRWPDGTVRVAQAQFTATLPANTTVTYRVVKDVQPMTAAFERHPWVAQLSGGLSVGAEVKDTFNVAYRGYLEGSGELLASTALSETRRHRTYHRAALGQGLGRDYLTSTFYKTEFRDLPIVIVDWVLGNDYLGSDAPNGSTDPNLYPLGGVDVTEARFLVRGAGVQPYRPVQEAIEAAQNLANGYVGFRVMQNTWLDDAQTRRYRFVLTQIVPGAAQAERDRWVALAGAMVNQPLRALATQDSWYRTEALGLLGGPIAGPANAATRAENEFQAWSNAGWFGTWGSRGDALITATTGTPRNHPLSPDLAHAVQANHHKLLTVLEQKAWAQAMRPYHLYGLQVGSSQRILLWDGVPIYPGSRDLSQESLGRRSLYASGLYAAYRTRVPGGSQRAHGWEHFDHEHWSTDLLFDYWTVSGDCWAQEELRQLGQSLKALMRLQDYSTAWMQAARAEGWCMQGFAQVYLATGDASIKDYAVRRAREIVDVQRNRSHASRAMVFQGTYPGTGFPGTHTFYMPWQHGAVLYGYLGAWRFFQEPVLLQICEDVVPAVQYAWLTNHQDPVRGLVAEGLRYYVPISANGQPVPANHFDATVGVKWGDSPLGGAHTFLIGGLMHLADATSDPAVRQGALRYGRVIRGTVTDSDRWDKWRFVLRDHHLD